MGAGMSRGRTPHKPRAAAVTPDDPEVVRRKDEQKDPSTITPVAVVDTPKIPEVEEDPGEAPKPRTADDASSDTDPEWTGAAKLECGKRDEKDSSTSMSVVEVLKKPTVEVLRVALKTDEPMEVQTLNINNTNSQLDDRASGSKSVISAKGGTTTAKKLQVAGKGKLVVGKEDEQKEVEEAKSVIYAQGESQTVKMTNGTKTTDASSDRDPEVAGAGEKRHEQKYPSTITPVVEVMKIPGVEEALGEAPKLGAADEASADRDPKSPFLSAAKIEATKALAKIEHLRQSAMELKSQGVKPIKLSKAAKLASDAFDKSILSEHIKAIEESKKEGNCCDLIPPPPLLQFRINATKNVILPHLSGRMQLKRPGIDLVSWKGSFAVPRSFMSGNRHIDEMNLVLFGVYMSVQDHLDVGQTSTALAKMGLQAPQSKDEEDDFKAAVRTLRTTAHNIQVSIVAVGGLPLREPALYWREAFPDVTF